MIGVGVVGCGYWGPKLMRCLSTTPGLRVAAACDTREGRRAHVARLHPGIPVHERLDQLLDRDDVQAVWVATPPETHHAVARRALLAGRHVLVEKPMTTSSADARDLVELAESRKRILQTGHTYLFSPAVSLLRDALDAGRLGRLRCVTAERINPAPPAAAVGVLWDLAVHDVAIVQHLVGRGPSSVSGRALGRREDGLIEAALIGLEFDGGVSASIHASWLSARKTRVVNLFGAGASLVFDDQAASPVLLFGAARDNRAQHGASDVELAYAPPPPVALHPEGPEPLLAECAALRDAILLGAPSPNGGREALAVVRVLEAAEASIEDSGRPRMPDAAGLCPAPARRAGTRSAAGMGP